MADQNNDSLHSSEYSFDEDLFCTSLEEVLRRNENEDFPFDINQSPVFKRKNKPSLKFNLAPSIRSRSSCDFEGFSQNALEIYKTPASPVVLSFPRTPVKHCRVLPYTKTNRKACRKLDVEKTAPVLSQANIYKKGSFLESPLSHCSSCISNNSNASITSPYCSVLQSLTGSSEDIQSSSGNIHSSEWFKDIIQDKEKFSHENLTLVKFNSFERDNHHLGRAEDSSNLSSTLNLSNGTSNPPGKNDYFCHDLNSSSTKAYYNQHELPSLKDKKTDCHNRSETPNEGYSSKVLVDDCSREYSIPSQQKPKTADIDPPLVSFLDNFTHNICQPSPENEDNLLNSAIPASVEQVHTLSGITPLDSNADGSPPKLCSHFIDPKSKCRRKRRIVAPELPEVVIHIHADLSQESNIFTSTPIDQMNKFDDFNLSPIIGIDNSCLLVPIESRFVISSEIQTSDLLSQNAPVYEDKNSTLAHSQSLNDLSGSDKENIDPNPAKFEDIGYFSRLRRNIDNPMRSSNETDE